MFILLQYFYNLIETKYTRRALDPILPTYLPAQPPHPPPLLTPSPAHPAYLGGGVVYSVSFIDAHHVRERGLRD